MQIKKENAKLKEEIQYLRAQLANIDEFKIALDKKGFKAADLNEMRVNILKAQLVK